MFKNRFLSLVKIKGYWRLAVGDWRLAGSPYNNVVFLKLIFMIRKGFFATATAYAFNLKRKYEFYSFTLLTMTTHNLSMK